MALSWCAFADSTSDKLLVEKTFSRDNTFCNLNKKKIQIGIRGEDKYTDADEGYFGQYAFEVNGTDYSLLPINKERFGRYRFFKGQNSLCTKSLAFPLGTSKVAILFLKENLPFKEKLIIQIYDATSGAAEEAIETHYATDKAEIHKDGFAFRIVPERTELNIGKVSINGIEYVYRDDEIAPWMSYGPKGFQILADKTFERSPWKKFFKNELEFLQASGWDTTQKKFLNPTVYSAINHQSHKECIYFSPAPQKISGAEAWRCKD